MYPIAMLLCTQWTMDGLIARILSNVDDGGACDGVRNTSL